MHDPDGERLESEVKEYRQHNRQRQDPESIIPRLAAGAEDEAGHPSRVEEVDEPEQGHTPGDDVKDLSSCLLREDTRAQGNSGDRVEAFNRSSREDDQCPSQEHILGG